MGRFRDCCTDSLLLTTGSVLLCSMYALFSIPFPEAFQMKRLQSRLQNTCAGFVTRRFAGVEDVVKLTGFQCVELNILKLTHKLLYDESFSVVV